VVEWFGHCIIDVSFSHLGHITTATLLEKMDTSLLNYLRHRKRISYKEISNQMRDIMQGCGWLHEHSILHGDIKPSNILCTASGTNLKLCDLGNAVDLRLNNSSDLFYVSPHYVCSVPYRAFELMRAPAGYRYGEKVDVWSTGIVLYELLHIKPMFWDMSIDEIWSQCKSGIHIQRMETDLRYTAFTEEEKNKIVRLFSHMADTCITTRFTAKMCCEDEMLINKSTVVMTRDEKMNIFLSQMGF